MNIKQLLYKYKHAIVVLYFPIYMTWFVLLEKRTNVHFTDIHCIVDDWIPFNEIFIIPYLLWFLYVFVVLAFLFFQTDHINDFYHTAAVLILGMTTSLLIYTIFPNMQSMRPTSFDRDNVFLRIITILYKTDTDTNVLPSIHVFNSLAIHAGVCRCHAFQKHKWIRVASLILCSLICLSTMFLKQHSFLDVVAAFALFLLIEHLVERFLVKPAK